MSYLQLSSLLFIILLLSACGRPTLEEVGGIQVQLKFAENSNKDSLSEDVKTLLQRFSALSPNPNDFKHKINGSFVIIDLPELKDITSVKRLLEWDRSLLLTYAIPSSKFVAIRRHLAEFLSTPSINKPYKKSSMIGLVAEKNKRNIEILLNSQTFKNAFPYVDKHYYGAEKMLGQYALFISAKDSPYIDESMFSKIDARQNNDTSEGILVVELADTYEDRIGQITGNDSTYLLHNFHNEVYISKIIKPHITDRSFLISGAFTPKVALVLGALWNSKELNNKFKIEDIILLGAE